MPNEGTGDAEEGLAEVSEHCLHSGFKHCSADNLTSLNGGQKGGDNGSLSEGRNLPRVLSSNTLNIVTSQPEEIPNLKMSISKYTAGDDKIITIAADSPKKGFLSRSDSCQEQCRYALLETLGDDKIITIAADSPKKGFLSRSDSCQEQCRVCQQQTEEPLIELGCRCRGELAKSHRTCIDIWFRTKGSNKCEICQQVAANVSVPETLPSANYWVWRVDSAYTGRHGERPSGCISPLWVAFGILIGGLLLDVLISVSLGVSALPVNIIIGVLIVLGLGTSLRLALECCQEWGARRNLQRVDLSPGYPPAV